MYIINIYEYICTIYNVCAIYQSSYAKIVRTVVSHLSEWPSSCLDLKAGCLGCHSNQWLSHAEEARNPVVAQFTRLCASAVQIWHWKPVGLLTRR